MSGSTAVATVVDVHCPSCGFDDTRVDRFARDRRRHIDPAAAGVRPLPHRFTTYERIDEVPLVVVKRSGERQPFDRSRSSPGYRRGQGPARLARQARNPGGRGRRRVAPCGRRCRQRHRRPCGARSAACARRGRLFAFRQRLQEVRRRGRLPPRSCGCWRSPPNPRVTTARSARTGSGRLPQYERHAVLPEASPAFPGRCVAHRRRPEEG